MSNEKLTPKQEAFCLAYLETGNASEAYRRCYNTSTNMAAATVNREAARLLVLLRQTCDRFFRFDRGWVQHGHRSSRAARRTAISSRRVAIESGTGAEYGLAAPRGR